MPAPTPAPPGADAYVTVADPFEHFAVPPTEETTSFRIRLLLLSRLRDALVDRGWTQAESALVLGIAQPRVSAIHTGKVGVFSIDRLVNLLSRLDVRVDEVLARADWGEAVGG